MDAYELSYAEPGKARVDDNLRLLTTQDSLDTQSLASMRAVHGVAKGIPGVHAIDDIGVTRLYLRLKCRASGELHNRFSSCRRKIIDPDMEPVVEKSWYRPDPTLKSLFDNTGYEMYEAANSAGKNCSEIAQVHISMKPPSEVLQLAKTIRLDGR
jgi:hypothetical protein